jgi:hypothetical protein
MAIIIMSRTSFNASLSDWAAHMRHVHGVKAQRWAKNYLDNVGWVFIAYA